MALPDQDLIALLADLDQQANLTAAFLDEKEVEQLWNSGEPRTMWSAIRPFVDDGEAIRRRSAPRRRGTRRCRSQPGGDQAQP